MGIATGTGNARLYIGGSPVARAYLGATQIHAGAGPEPSTQYLAITDKLLFPGRGPVDVIVPGSGDPRQTLTALLPDGPRLWRKAGIPGSTMHLRRGWRNGDDQGGMAPPPPAPTERGTSCDRGPCPDLDPADFDALPMTEGGPVAPALNPDRFNSGWNASEDYLDRW